MLAIWGGCALGFFAAALACAYVALAQASKEHEIDESGFVASARRYSRDYVTIIDPGAAKVVYPVPLDEDLQEYIIDKALAKEISPTLVFAIIGVESDYNVDEIGDGGKSYGLMQIYAAEHTERCKRLGAERLLEPKANIDVGIDYLAELFGYEKSLEWVLMAYNGGVSYANDMEAAGNVSEYAKRVKATMEVISEGIMAQ